MSRVWSQTMEDIATASGCDWDFVVDMHNYIFDTQGDVDIERLANGIVKRDWSTRGKRIYLKHGCERYRGRMRGYYTSVLRDGRFEDYLQELSNKTGYSYERLFSILVDMIYDPNDETTMDEFIAITLERDW